MNSKIIEDANTSIAFNYNVGGEVTYELYFKNIIYVIGIFLKIEIK